MHLFLSYFRIVYEGLPLDVENENEIEGDSTTPNAKKGRPKNVKVSRTELTPKEVQDILRQLWGRDAEILKQMFPMLKSK